MAERLTSLDLDFLWESFGGGEPPYPIEMRSHGETMDERDTLRQQALADLADRGLADDRGRPQPHVADVLDILSSSDVSLDSVQIDSPTAESRLAVAAARCGQSGVLAIQESHGVLLQRIPVDGLANAIVGQLPVFSGGQENSIVVPLEQLLAGPGVDFLQRRSGSPDGVGLTASSDRKALARLHAQERRRGGQIGANARRDSGTPARAPVLSWFDTYTGRYFTQASRGDDGRDWITIAPADAETLRDRLSEMLAGAADSPR